MSAPNKARRDELREEIEQVYAPRLGMRVPLDELRALIDGYERRGAQIAEAIALARECGNFGLAERMSAELDDEEGV